jgi:hypothetical protein
MVDLRIVAHKLNTMPWIHCRRAKPALLQPHCCSLFLFSFSLCVSSFCPVLELSIRTPLQVPDASTTPDLTAARTHTLTRPGKELGFGASRTGTLGARVSRASRAETLQLWKPSDRHIGRLWRDLGLAEGSWRVLGLQKGKSGGTSAGSVVRTFSSFTTTILSGAWIWTQRQLAIAVWGALNIRHEGMWCFAHALYLFFPFVLVWVLYLFCFGFHQIFDALFWVLFRRFFLLGSRPGSFSPPLFLLHNLVVG